MKKIILAALVIASVVFAQTSSKIDVKFGAHAAFNYGQAWGENSDNFGLEGGPGFTGGLDVKFAVSPQLFIVTGLEYEYRTVDWNIGKLLTVYAEEMSGSISRSDREMMSAMKVSFGLGYLDIPVFARFYPVPQFYVDAGAYIGFNVSSTMDVSIEGLGRSMDTPKQMQKDSDYGIIVGLGFSVNPNFDVYARYTMGFADMVDVVKVASLSGNEVDYSEGPTVECKNMRFQIGVAFWFN